VLVALKELQEMAIGVAEESADLVAAIDGSLPDTYICERRSKNHQGDRKGPKCVGKRVIDGRG
jgi:hypothetical protein